MNHLISHFVEDKVTLKEELSFLFELHAYEKNGIKPWIKKFDAFFSNSLKAECTYYLQKNKRKINLFQLNKDSEARLIQEIKFTTDIQFESSLQNNNSGFINFKSSFLGQAFPGLGDIELPSNKLFFIYPLFQPEEEQPLLMLFQLVAAPDEEIQVPKRFIDEIQLSFNNTCEFERLEKKCQNMEAHNQALETSLQATHENAVKFLKVHKKLTESIQYATKIQTAILPTDKLFDRIFDEHFVIYEPKDMVSGDFYWLSQVDYTFLAVVDCTGHGVPGAFMSMIGNTLLSEIVNAKRVSDPAQILSLLHEGVRNSLKQADSQNEDGMDVCLIKLQRDENFRIKLTFAGAKRPLFYVRNKEIYKIKGDRESIGGYQRKDRISFTSHTMTMEDGDVVFLTSDGFVDAANVNRKSFGSIRFQEIIKNNAILPLVDQKKILENALKDHQQETQQRDDITVVAIKL